MPILKADADTFQGHVGCVIARRAIAGGASVTDVLDTVAPREAAR